jgi:hypothetical protein
LFFFGCKCGYLSLGCHWARDGPKFAYKVDGCDAFYTTKYNLVQHLWAQHNVVVELGKPEHPSTWEEGPRVQIHILWLLAWLHGVWGPSIWMCQPSWSTMRTLHLWFKWFDPSMQRHSEALGWSVTKSLHQIKQCNIRRLASLHNTMIHGC